MPAKSANTNRRSRQRILGLQSLEHRHLMAGDAMEMAHQSIEALSIREISAEEQLAVELINRARANPAAELSRMQSVLSEETLASIGPLNQGPLPPLAVDAMLTQAAGDYAKEVADTQHFSHTGLDLSTPETRANAVGFTGGVGENLAARSYQETLPKAVENMHSQLFGSEGHRANLLSVNYDRIGLGIETHPTDTIPQFPSELRVEIQMFGWKQGSNSSFLTGVAYTDELVDDDFYTVGEAMAGVSIVVLNDSGSIVTTAQTSSSGGYAIELPHGQYWLQTRLTDGRLFELGSIEMRGENVKLDIVKDQLTTDTAANEQLENQRRTLADINQDGEITHIDALIVINRINRGQYDPTMDQNADGVLTPMDALRIVNRIGATFVATGPASEGQYASDTFEGELIDPRDWPFDTHPTGPYLPGRLAPDLGLDTPTASATWQTSADIFWSDCGDRDCDDKDLRWPFFV